MTKSNIHSDKNSQQTRNRRELPPLDKGCLQQKLVRLNALLLRSGTREGYLLSPLPFRIPARAISKEKRKSTVVGKEEIKRSLFADDMFISAKNLMGSTKKLLELMSEFNRFPGS